MKVVSKWREDRIGVVRWRLALGYEWWMQWVIREATVANQPPLVLALFSWRHLLCLLVSDFWSTLSCSPVHTNSMVTDQLSIS